MLTARAYAREFGIPALADDSGLEVDALDGFPGVLSSRWTAGADADRVEALLARMSDVPEGARTARFRSVAALALPDGRCATASGSVEGRIARGPRGTSGFGYDPVFLVEDGGYTGDRTMAELPPEEKNRLSHRVRAVTGLIPISAWRDWTVKPGRPAASRTRLGRWSRPRSSASPPRAACRCCR